MRSDYRDDSCYYLQQAAELIGTLPDEIYSNDQHDHFASGVGKHVRHILDHYFCLLNGLENKINYDSRERDSRIETDRNYAVACINSIIEQVHGLDTDTGVLTVQSTPGTAADDQLLETASTLQRELQFLASHTVHHFALIALLLKLQGIAPPREFGVAPSTLRHEHRKPGLKG